MSTPCVFGTSGGDVASPPGGHILLWPRALSRKRIVVALLWPTCRLMKAYLRYIAGSSPSITQARLLCKQDLVSAMVPTYLVGMFSVLGCERGVPSHSFTHPPFVAGQVGLYVGVGFQLLGPSAVVHGSEQWLEMALSLASQERKETNGSL